MSVDLGDLIEAIKSEVSPPGTDLFPNATEDEWIINLQNAFWEAKLFDFFGNFYEADGLIQPNAGSTDMDRTQQQLIVLFAGARILRNELRNINTTFKSKAGPVEFETQKSANLLRDLLNDVRSKIMWQLQAVGSTNTFYIDSVTGRADSMITGQTFWTG